MHAETLILNKLVKDAVFAARQIEALLYGNYEKIIIIHLYTDSEGTLESIASTKQIIRKSLWIVIQDLKKTLTDGKIS